jgi:hypothetical protein
MSIPYAISSVHVCRPPRRPPHDCYKGNHKDLTRISKRISNKVLENTMQNLDALGWRIEGEIEQSYLLASHSLDRDIR